MEPKNQAKYVKRKGMSSSRFPHAQMEDPSQKLIPIP